MRKWTRQPPAGTPIDWSNPLTRGLVFAAPTADGRDAVTGNLPNTVRANNIIAPANMGRFGSAMASQAAPGTTTNVGRLYPDTYAHSKCFGQPGFTMWSLQISKTGDTWEMPFCIDLRAGDNDRIGYQGSSSNVNIYYRIGYSDDTDLSVTTPTQEWPANALSTLCMRFDRTKATERIEMFVDNVRVDSDNASDKAVGWTSEANSNTIIINDSDQPATNDNFDGPVALALMWNRALTDAELEQLEQNPWQIFKPPKQFALADVPGDVRFLPVEKPWKKQPPVGTPIDWTNPLTHGLGAAIVPHYDTWYDVVHNVFATMDDGATISVDQYGRHTDFDGVDTAVNMGRKYNEEIPGFDNAGGPHSSFLVINHDGGSGNFWGVRASGSDVKLQLYTNDGDDFNYRSGGTSKEFSTTTFAANGYFTCGHSLGSTSDLRGYANGVQQGATTTQDGTPQTASGATLEIGNHTQGFPYGAKIYCLFLWNRALTSTEHAALNENPWQIFKPQIIHAPADVALPDLATFERDW